MNDISKRIAALSPEQKAIFERRLQAQTSKQMPLQKLPRNGSEQTFPVSFAQERLWFLEQLEAEANFHNLPMIMQLKGTVHIPILAQSISEIVRRHEALRTVFTTVDGRPVQIIKPARLLAIPVVDLQNIPAAEKDSERLQLVIGEVQKPFDLARDLLIRLLLLDMGESTYTFVITVHHISIDGWSISIFIQELMTIYQALIVGETPRLPEIPLQYADFSVWQRQQLQGVALNKQLAYWKQKLGDNLSTLELPTDHPRPPIQLFRGAEYVFILSEELTTALRMLGRQEGVTPFMLLLAAFKTLLYRYTGQPDIIVGTAVANRTQKKLENLIGFFVNTLVLRTNVTNTLPFNELLKQVKRGVTTAFAHQDIPFERLVNELHPIRDLSRNPLFQVMFTLQNTSLPTFELPGLTVDPVEVDMQTSQFDLTVIVSALEKVFQVRFNYNIGLFDEATIIRMAQHFNVLLESIVHNPQQQVSKIAFLTQSEMQQLTLAWNNTVAPYPQEMMLHELFERQARETPDAVAVIHADMQITYRELEQQANQLAHHLQTLGACMNVPVTICMERSIEMVVALLGVLKAGSAYIPLDPTYPPARLAFMLEDSQSPILLTQKHLRPFLESSAPHFVCVDALIAENRPQQMPTPVTGLADSLAYLIYTSGSTGKPKSVSISHRSVVNFILAVQQQPGITAQDRLLSVTTLSFDIAVLEIFLPLTMGACLIIAEQEIVADGFQLQCKLTAVQATIMQATPSTWQMLLKSDWPGNKNLKLLCGGEALLGSLANQLQMYGASLWNMYGPTETTIWSAVYPVTDPQTSITPIGKPIANTQIYILDSSLYPVPIGVSGELYIGGDGLSQGYHQRPRLTAEKFVPNPFPTKPGERVYRTGDLAHFQPDGNIQYLGRVDHQVKIRGFRIEPGEIEAALTQQEAVYEVVLTAQTDGTGYKRLVAYLVGNPLPDEQLRAALKHTLPDYMIPARFMWLDQMPLLPNGKVNRHALPAPDTSRPNLATTFTQARTEVEAALAQIWMQVLDVEQVGIHDNFFELGGDSIFTVQVAIRSNQIGLQVTPRQLFQNQTIAQLATVVKRLPDHPAQTSGNNHAIEIPASVIKRVTDIYPALEEFYYLSPMQQGILFHARYAPHAGMYIGQVNCTILGKLQVSLFKQAWQQVIAQHPILRTSFFWDNLDAPPLQIVHTNVSLPWQEEDWRSLAPDDQKTKLDQHVAQERFYEFDLTQAPVARACLLQLTEQAYQFVWSYHHLLLDGWSMSLVFKDLFAIYESLIQHQPVPLRQTASYRKYIAWLSQQDREAAKAFWQDSLHGFTRSTPLFDLADGRLAHEIASHGKEIATLSTPETNKLISFAQKHHLTLNTLAQAAWAILLGRYSHEDDIVFGTIVSGRPPNLPGVEHIVGMFINALPVRIYLDDASVLTWLKNIQHQQVERSCYEYSSLVDIQNWSEMPHAAPLFESLLVFENYPFDTTFQEQLQELGLEVTGLRTVELTNYPIHFMISLEKQLNLLIVYDEGRFVSETIKRILAQFQMILQDIITQPQQRVANISITTGKSAKQHINDFNEDFDVL